MTNKIIEAFQKAAEDLHRNPNSVEELKLWLEAAEEELDKETPKYKKKLKDIQKSRGKLTQEQKDEVWKTMGDLARGKQE